MIYKLRRCKLKIKSLILKDWIVKFCVGGLYASELSITSKALLFLSAGSIIHGASISQRSSFKKEE